MPAAAGDRVLPAGRAALPADVAAPGPAAGPKRLGVPPARIATIADGSPSWVAFPGFWGELEYFNAPAPIGTVPFGASPVGPAFHEVWPSRSPRSAGGASRKTHGAARTALRRAAPARAPEFLGNSQVALRARFNGACLHPFLSTGRN